MADGVFNIAKGRAAEFHERVNNNDPANSALIVVLLASSGLVADGTLKDYDTLADILAGASNEATNTGYARKTLTDADITAITVDDTNDRVDADIPDQSWSNVAADGTGDIGKLLVCYDPDTTGGTDSAIIPLTYQDFTASPNGGAINAQINTSGYFRAA